MIRPTKSIDLEPKEVKIYSRNDRDHVQRRNSWWTQSRKERLRRMAVAIPRRKRPETITSRARAKIQVQVVAFGAGSVAVSSSRTMKAKTRIKVRAIVDPECLVIRVLLLD